MICARIPSGKCRARKWSMSRRNEFTWPQVSIQLRVLRGPAIDEYRPARFNKSISTLIKDSNTIYNSWARTNQRITIQMYKICHSNVWTVRMIKSWILIRKSSRQEEASQKKEVASQKCSLNKTSIATIFLPWTLPLAPQEEMCPDRMMVRTPTLMKEASSFSKSDSQQGTWSSN